MVDRLRDTSESHERCTIVEVMGRRAGYLALNAGIAVGATSIIIPEINVSVSGADRAQQSETGTTAITAEATEGARLMWYVNGMFQEGQTGSVFELSCAYPGAYDVTCVAVSEDGTLAKSASMCVVVTR